MIDFKLNSWASQERSTAFDKFVRAANHDLRVPVEAVSLFADLAEDSLANSENHTDILKTLIANTRMVGSEIKNLFSKLFDGLSRGSIEYTIAAFNPTELKDEVLTKKPLFENDKIKLEVSTTTNFQNLSNFYSDKPEITRVINVLVTNAFEELKEKGIKGTVQVKLDYSAAFNHIKIEVENPGTLTPDQLTKVFDPSYSTKLDQRDTSHPSGTGLYNARAICESLGGKLNVNNSNTNSIPKVLFTATILNMPPDYTTKTPLV